MQMNRRVLLTLKLPPALLSDCGLLGYGTNITFTGHSLGGGQAALMGVFFNRQAVTSTPRPITDCGNPFDRWFCLISIEGAPARAGDDQLDGGEGDDVIQAGDGNTVRMHMIDSLAASLTSTHRHRRQRDEGGFA